MERSELTNKLLIYTKSNAVGIAEELLTECHKHLTNIDRRQIHPEHFQFGVKIVDMGDCHSCYRFLKEPSNKSDDTPRPAAYKHAALVSRAYTTGIAGACLGIIQEPVAQEPCCANCCYFKSGTGADVPGTCKTKGINLYHVRTLYCKKHDFGEPDFISYVKIRTAPDVVCQYFGVTGYTPE